MNYTPTENDYRLLFQRTKQVFVKIELLNKCFQVIDEIQGDVLDANLSVDGNNDIRRTLDLSIHVNDRSYIVASDSKVWFDKYIRCHCGIYDERQKKEIWYLLGTFIFTDSGYDFDATTRTLNLNCLDLMATLTKERGSEIGADTTVIEVDTDIRSAMIGVLEQFARFRQYNVCDFPHDIKTVPYDLEFQCGVNPYDILSELSLLYPCYQIFCDVDGTFVCQKIPSTINDPVLLEPHTLDRLIIKETRRFNFEEVKNVSEIWGQSLETDYYAENCMVQGTIVHCAYDFENFKLVTNKRYGFTPVNHDAPANPTIKIDWLGEMPLVYKYYKSDGSYVIAPLPAGTIKKGRPYVAKYDGEHFVFMGELEVHSVVKEVAAEPDATQKEQDVTAYDCDNIAYVVNPDSPFCVEKIGEIRKVYSGGEYDNIYTSALAIERASYENWKTTRFVDIVSLTCVAIPWLDVNTKISFTSQVTGEKDTYLVNSININFADFTMDLGLTKFYPYYPFVTETT